jgi:hypothetical protein
LGGDLVAWVGKGDPYYMASAARHVPGLVYTDLGTFGNIRFGRRFKFWFILKHTYNTLGISCYA